jgi:uncharacterized repeat protein (TIGR03803 family)
MASTKQDQYKEIPIRNWKPCSAALILACAVCLFCAATAIASPAQTFTTLVDFGGTNGDQPMASLVQGTDGNFYGTTYEGGDLTCGPPYGCGTVFQITAAGTLTTLHNFESTDGLFPEAGLILARDSSETPDDNGFNARAKQIVVETRGDYTQKPPAHGQ